MAGNEIERKKRRRWPWAVAGLVLLGGLVLAPVLMQMRGAQGAAAEAQVASGEVVSAVRGDLSSKATASGNVEAHREARLSLEIAGTVQEVPVSLGDAVQAGDVLVQLDPVALERAVTNAELNLAIQEANLNELLGGASDADLASAQAAVESARANLADVKDGAAAGDLQAARAAVASAQAANDGLLDGPDAESVAQAQATFNNSQAALQQAQAAYDRVAGDPNIGMRREALELQQATNNFASAKAAYELATKGASQEQLKQARANLDQARASLQKLQNSPTPVELAAAESQLAQAQAGLDTATEGASVEKIEIARAQAEQARLNLTEAKEKLEKASLRAPFAGVVTALYVAEGEQASGLAAELADTSTLELVLKVDEVDVGQLAVGQPAIIRLETWPDREIQGTVTSIAPRAADAESGAVAYEVRVTMGESDLPVRIGMTADADLVLAAKDGVLLVPSQAITADREAGTYSVQVVTDGPDGAQVFTKTPVTIGLKDGDNTEITSGLRDGERVLIGEIVSAPAQQLPGFMPPRPGGADGGGPFGQ